MSVVVNEVHTHLSRALVAACGASIGPWRALRQVFTAGSVCLLRGRPSAAFSVTCWLRKRGLYITKRATAYIKSTINKVCL